MSLSIVPDVQKIHVDSPKSLDKKSNDSRTNRRWLVLYTKPRHEKKTYHLLCDEQIEAFLPLREEIHKWADRKKRVEVPLFSSYIFVFVNEKQRITALELDGAMKYVRFGEAIAVVRQQEIENIRLALNRRDDIRIEETYFQVGKSVKVVHGPMRGMTGMLIEKRGHTRVAIQIEAIHQVVSVEVPVGDLILV